MPLQKLQKKKEKKEKLLWIAVHLLCIKTQKKKLFEKNALLLHDKIKQKNRFLYWCFRKSVNDLSATCQYRPLPEHHIPFFLFNFSGEQTPSTSTLKYLRSFFFFFSPLLLLLSQRNSLTVGLSPSSSSSPSSPKKTHSTHRERRLLAQQRAA